MGMVRSLYLKYNQMHTNKKDKTSEVKSKQSPPRPPEKWVQMSLGSYGRSPKQHLFLLVLPLTTGAINGQLDGASGVFLP